MQSSYQVITVFSKPNEAFGNQAAIILNKDNHPSLLSEQSILSENLYKTKGLATTCFISHIDHENYKVECFNGKNMILCCGHGMIAAAKILFSKEQTSKLMFNKNITAAIKQDNKGYDIVELELPRILAQPQTLPAWVNKLILSDEKELKFQHAAISEREDGYLLLEFNPVVSEKDFRQMKLDLELICEKSKRAIVVIQFDKIKKHLYMRYFAPQYGINEDIATGSVMRFVADYIEQQYQVREFAVSQCSVNGGFMQINCNKDSVKILANAYIEAS